MNINTKQMTAIAVISLFAYTANAQTATSNADPGFGFLANFEIEPEGDATPDLFVTVAGEELLIVDGQVDDGTDRILTNLTKVGTATASVTTSIVGNGAQGPNSVMIQNDGINLNTVTSSTNTASLDRYTESVQTIDLDPTSPTFTDSVTVYTAWATVSGAGPTGTRLFEETGTDEADALSLIDAQITFIDATSPDVAAALVIDDEPTTTGGTLNVGGNAFVGGVLSLAGNTDPDGDPATDDGWDAVGNVAQQVTANLELSGQNALGVFDNDAAITGLENFIDQTDGLNTDTQTVVGAINEVESEVAFNLGAIGNNINDIGQIQNSIIGSDVDFLAADVADALQTESGNLVGAINENVTDIANMQDDTVVGSLAFQIEENEDFIEENEDAIEENEDAIVILNSDADVEGSVANSIAAANADSGISSGGITGVVEKQTNAAGDDIVKLGANSFFFNSTTDTISSTSGDITLAADVAITGDLEVAGDIFVGGRSQGVQSQIDNNREDIDRNARGIAMVAALQHTTVLPGMSNALDVSAAHFEGETGLALNYARRISDNVQINFGAASTSDFDESVIKAGVGVQW